MSDELRKKSGFKCYDSCGIELDPYKEPGIFDAEYIVIEDETEAKRVMEFSKRRLLIRSSEVMDPYRRKLVDKMIKTFNYPDKAGVYGRDGYGPETKWFDLSPIKDIQSYLNAMSEAIEIGHKEYKCEALDRYFPIKEGSFLDMMREMHEMMGDGDDDEEEEEPRDDDGSNDGEDNDDGNDDDLPDLGKAV